MTTLSDNIQRIQEELRLHDRAMSASSCGITIADALDPNLPLIYVNEAFEHVTGYPVPEVVGRNCRFLQRDDRDQPGLTMLRNALQRGENCTITLRNYRKDGSLFWNELFTSPVFDPNGKLTHFVGIQTDISSRKSAEEQLVTRTSELERTIAELRSTQAMLVHAEKMNALGQMVAGVAHEINNPISFVNSNLHSLRRSLDDLFGAYNKLEILIRAVSNPDTLQAAEIIRKESDLDFLQGDADDLLGASIDGLGRVRRIVEALRTFSRLDEAELKIIRLSENIQSTLMIARLELQNRVDVATDLDHLPAIKCYPAELNQVFLNLIVNAAQAIEGHGSLIIRGKDEPQHIVLTFTDTGKGMTPEVIAHMFDPFFTTKPVGAGTGLGLTIAYKIIHDRHRGKISVESTPGVGTTFTIRLPKDL